MKWHKQWINSFKCASNDSMGICKNVFYVAQCFLLNFHFIFVNINFFVVVLVFVWFQSSNCSLPKQTVWKQTIHFGIRFMWICASFAIKICLVGSRFFVLARSSLVTEENSGTSKINVNYERNRSKLVMFLFAWSFSCSWTLRTKRQTNKNMKLSQFSVAVAIAVFFCSGGTQTVTQCQAQKKIYFERRKLKTHYIV